MAFFTPLPEPAREPEPIVGLDDEADYEPPEWSGPTRGFVGADIDCRAVLAKDDQLYLWLDRAVAYPNGFVLDLGLQLAGPLPDGKMIIGSSPWVIVDRDERSRRRGGPPLPSAAGDIMRFGVEFADGRSTQTGSGWAGRGNHDDPFDPERSDVFLGAMGGQGDFRVLSQSYWVWPFPPPGPVTLHVAWPGLGVAETSHPISTAAIEEAAGKIEPIWPEPLASPDR